MGEPLQAGEGGDVRAAGDGRPLTAQPQPRQLRGQRGQGRGRRGQEARAGRGRHLAHTYIIVLLGENIRERCIIFCKLQPVAFICEYFESAFLFVNF